MWWFYRDLCNYNCPLVRNLYLDLSISLFQGWNRECSRSGHQSKLFWIISSLYSVGAEIVGKGEVIVVCVSAAVAAVIGDPARTILMAPNSSTTASLTLPSLFPNHWVPLLELYSRWSHFAAHSMPDCYWDWLYPVLAFTNCLADVNLLGLSDFPLAQTAHIAPSIFCLTWASGTCLGIAWQCRDNC